MIANVQVLRALAAFLVVVFHLQLLLTRAGGPSFGNGGVDVFFVISGFIMVHVTRGPADPLGFLRNRVTRVAPLYWTLTLALFAVAAVAPAIFKNTTGDVLDLVRSLLFIPFQKAAVGGPQPILFVGWTLNYEMFFYALFALGLFAPKRWQGVVAVIALLIALAVAGQLFRPAATIPAFYTSTLILEFAAGMALGLILPHLPERAPAWARWLVLAIGVAALGMLVVSPTVQMDHTLYYGPPAAVLVAAALVLERWGWSTRNRVLLLLGDASYSLYLTHIFVTIPVVRLGDKLGVTGLTAAAMMAVGLIGATLLALGVYHLVEKPVTALARRSFGGTPPKPKLAQEPNSA